MGQGISNLGDTFHLFAVTVLLYKITGSGLSTGFGIICAPIPSLLLSPIAGSLGDRFSERRLLVLIDILRGIVTAAFIFKFSTLEIYFLLLILSSLNVLYGPPSKKIIVRILSKSDIVTGNAILGGLSGLSFLVGPILAAIIIEFSGLGTAFIINSISFFFSAFSILILKVNFTDSLFSNSGNKLKNGIWDDLRKGMKYLRKTCTVREMVATGSVLCFCSSAMNMAFYPFAFDLLKITSRGWGFMLSIFYGTGIISMLISIYFINKIKSAMQKIIYFSLFLVSILWVSYVFADNVIVIMGLQLLEGTALSLCGILIITSLQTNVRGNLISRVMGINDLLNSFGKLLGIACALIILQFSSPRLVFALNGIILIIFSINKLFLKNSYKLST
jgi:MFS family permease